MTDVPTIQFEAKKDGFSQLQNGSVKLSLTVHPNDVAVILDFVKAPMGTRYAVVIVEIGDDEQPVGKPADKAEKSPGQRAVIRAALLCKDPEFWKWARVGDERDAILHVHMKCGVQSRAEFAKSTGALRTFLTMETTFQQQTGRMAEER